jgi:hypothetical protein
MARRDQPYNRTDVYDEEDLDEEELGGLVQRPPAMLGLKFHDDEDRDMVRLISFGAISVAVVSVLLFIANLHHHGSPGEAGGHILLSLGLPVIGYYGVKQESTRLVWIFHFGYAQFAVFHAVIVMIMIHVVMEIEADPAEAVCRRYHPPAVQAAQAGHGEVVAVNYLYQECLQEVAAKKANIPWKLFWWAIMTTPLWGLQSYIAYTAHEYYFRLRIRGLMARTGEGGGGTAVVVERDALPSDAIE